MSLIEEKEENTSAGRWQQIRREYRVVLSATFRSSAAWFFFPLLYPLASWTFNFLGPGNGFANWIAAPVLLFILPLIVLLLLGVRWGEIGLGRGYHGWRVALLWSILPLIGLGVFLIWGIASLRSLKQCLAWVLPSSLRAHAICWPLRFFMLF